MSLPTEPMAVGSAWKCAWQRTSNFRCEFWWKKCVYKVSDRPINCRNNKPAQIYTWAAERWNYENQVCKRAIILATFITIPGYFWYFSSGKLYVTFCQEYLVRTRYFYIRKILSKCSCYLKKIYLRNNDFLVSRIYRIGTKSFSVNIYERKTENKIISIDEAAICDIRVILKSEFPKNETWTLQVHL